MHYDVTYFTYIVSLSETGGKKCHYEESYDLEVPNQSEHCSRNNPLITTKHFLTLGSE